MSLKLSKSFCNKLIGASSGVTSPGTAKAQIDGLMKVYLYKGTVPATASDAIGTATLCGTASNGGSAVNMAATPTNGILGKLSSETWGGNYVASGTLSFFRLQRTDDDGAADTGDGARPRIQGVINSANAELLVGNPVVVSGDPFTFNSMTLAITPS